MFKPITLNPATYLSLLLGTCLIVFYLLFRTPPGGFDPHSPIFKQHEGDLHYESMAELLADVKKHQALREYQAIIEILNRTDLDALVSRELTKPFPSIVFIDGFDPIAYGIENHGNLRDKYNCLSFPDTTDVITDPGFDFWILWAKDFTSRYNAKLESELKRRNQ